MPKKLFISARPLEFAEIAATKVAQGKTFNNEEEYYQAAHAVDKDLSTQASPNTDDGAGWLKLEFGKTHFIHKVVIYYRFYNYWYDPSSWCVQSEANFKSCVDVSNNVDVSVYQGEVKQNSCGTLQLTYGLEQSDQIYTLICNTEGDTVKLSKTTEHISVFEVAVVGKGMQLLLSYTKKSTMTKGLIRAFQCHVQIILMRLFSSKAAFNI